jgi:group I intron endonuclease
MKHKVYEIRNQINGKGYYGVTGLTLAKRFSAHCGKKTPLGYAIRKYGKENFTITTRLTGCREFCYDMEPVMIARFQTMTYQHGYNQSKGGIGGAVGTVRSPETRAKMSEARKLVVLPPVSQEARAKHAENMRQRMQDPEAKARASGLGRKHNEETKEVMSEKRSAWLAIQDADSKSKMTTNGREASIKSRVQTFWLKSPDGEEFTITNLKQFCRDRGLDNSSLTKVANGKYRHAKFWLCRRIVDGKIVIPPERM